MLIKKMKLSDIVPADYNPRKDLRPGDPDYEKIKRSLERFDLVEPLIWNERTGTLVGGHQRLKVLKERGITEVEVSVVDLPPEDERALNLALNRTGGGWDYDKLSEVLASLDESLKGYTGFDLTEIEAITASRSVLDDVEYGFFRDKVENDLDTFRVTLNLPKEAEKLYDEFMKRGTRDDLAEAVVEFLRAGGE